MMEFLFGDLRAIALSLGLGILLSMVGAFLLGLWWGSRE